MRKITFLLGAGIGFIAGSRAGQGPYQQIEAKVREVTKRPSGGQASEAPMTTADGPLVGTAAAASPAKSGEPLETLMDVPVVLPAGTEL